MSLECLRHLMKDIARISKVFKDFIKIVLGLNLLTDDENEGGGCIKWF